MTPRTGTDLPRDAITAALAENGVKEAFDIYVGPEPHGYVSDLGGTELAFGSVINLEVTVVFPPGGGF